MVNIRALLAGTAAVHLARAATIATRYLAGRRQFAAGAGDEETQARR